MSEAPQVLDIAVPAIVIAALALGLRHYIGEARYCRGLLQPKRQLSVGALETSAIEARTARSLVGVAAGISVATGLAVLGGWIFDVSTLKSVVPGFVTMKVNTAVGLTLAGTSLALSERNSVARRVSLAVAIAVALLGVVTGCEYVFGLDFGIDQLLLPESVGEVGTLAPGRMAPTSAVNFAIIGTALALVGARRSIRAAQQLATLSGLIGLMSLVADLYGARNPLGIRRFTQMAIHTEVAFVCLSLGILLVHPNQAMMRQVTANTPGGWLLRRLAPVAVGIPLGFGWLQMHGEQAGYFDGPMGAVLMAITGVSVSALLVWYAAALLTHVDDVRANAEVKAAESSEETVATLHGVGDGVITTDSAGRILRMNPVAEHLTGWAEAEATGRPLAEVVRIVNEQTLAVVDSPATNFMRRGRVRTSSHPVAIVARDGSMRPIADSGAPICDARGQVRGMVLVIRDQTAERASLAAVRQAVANFATAFQDSPVAMVILSRSTREFVDVNDAFVREIGFTRDDVVGHTPRDVGLFVEPAGHDALSSAVFANGAVNNIEILVRGKVGSTCTCLLSLSTIQLAKEPHLLVSLVDISERKRVEEQLRAALSTSQHLLSVADRSRSALLSIMEDQKQEQERRKELEDQLHQAQRMESVGRLAGGVAHDFNNLISIILNFTGFAMNMVPEGTPLRADLVQVKKAAERAAALTQQLLAFGRRQVLHQVPLDLNRVVHDLETMLRRVVGEDISLVLDLAPDIGVAQADPGQMEQVLLNLVVNARDAMPRGGVLTIATANIEVPECNAAPQIALTPGHYVRLRVADTGCGMDEQTQSRLFDPFFTTKAKGKGTGLGLSTVHGIVSQSGGSVHVESEVGNGTSFEIHLPRDLLATARVSSSPPSLRAVTGTESILVVDDEDALREAARRVLEAAGYTPLLAANGDEALRISAEQSRAIDLLLTDVVMPGMNGSTLASEVAKIRPTLPVLFMSGHTDDAMAKCGMLNESFNFVRKPFTAPELTHKVREVLDAAAARRATGHGQANPQVRSAALQPLDAAMFRMLPRVVLNKLRDALLAAQHDRIVAVAERIRLTAPDVADALRQRVDLFDYDAILRLIGEPRERAS